LFISVNKTITTLREETVEFAFVGSISIGQTIVTLFTSVNNTITARWLHSISSASTWSAVRVKRSIITFLTWFNQTIIEGAVRGLGDIEVKLREEFGFGGSNIVQERETDKRSVSGLMEQLNFKISMSTINGVLRGRVELNLGERSSTEDVVARWEEDESLSVVQELDERASVVDLRKTSSNWVEALDLFGVDVDGGLGGINSVSSAESKERRSHSPFARHRSRSWVGTISAWWSWSGPGVKGNEGVSENSLEFAISGTFLASCGTIVTLFSHISNIVTTRWFHAVLSASVGFPVRVEETTEIALLPPLLDSVATNWRWRNAWSGDTSVVERLKRSGSVGETVLGISEGSILSVRHGLHFREDKPVVVLSTGWVCQRTSVREGSFVGRKGKFEDNWSLDLSLSAVVGNTESGASIDLEVVVVGTVITLLSIGGINDTITAVWDSAVGTASVGSGVGVVDSGIALFEGVNNTITTEWELAVESAVVSNVSVGSSKITFLTPVEATVSAFTSASGVATVTTNIVTIVAGFAAVNDTITTTGQ